MVKMVFFILISIIYNFLCLKLFNSKFIKLQELIQLYFIVMIGANSIMDFKKILTVFLNKTSIPKICALLQALRWRITKSVITTI